jgi:hypothetical protein
MHRRHQCTTRRPGRFAAHAASVHPSIDCAAEQFVHPHIDLESIPGPIKFRDTKRWSDWREWESALAADYVKLLVETGTMNFIRAYQVPKGRLVSYLNPQCSIKNKGGIVFRRVRNTYGGNRSDYQGEVSASTADMATVKLHLQSVISTPGARFMSIDIKDFYLGTVLDRPEYMRIMRSQLPQEIIDRFELEPMFSRSKDGKAVNDYVFVEVVKGIYGLPQAGLLAQQKPNECRSTPCLYKHASRPISFTLVVDDFGVKVTGAIREHIDHLLAALRTEYTLTVDETGAKYLGIDLAWDYQNGTVALSMNRYVHKALERFAVPTRLHRTDSPLVYTPPAYCQRVQQLATEEDTSQLSHRARRSASSRSLRCSSIMRAPSTPRC